MTLPPLLSTPLLVGLHPIKAAYVGVMGASVLALLVMNYLIKTKASTSRLEALVPVHNVSIIWATLAAIGLLVEHRELSLLLVYLRTLPAYASSVLFLWFATVYTGRSTSLRRPFNAVYLAGICVGVGALLTDPWLGLHFDPLVYHTEPFPYYETGYGPVWRVMFLWTTVALLVAVYYLIELFVTSQYRSSRALLVYSVGMVLAQVPNVLTALNWTPTLPGYDHSVFVLSIATVAFFMGAWFGMIDIAPISRNKLLETTDDMLIVLDTQGQIADHNAAAAQLFTDQAPVGTALRDTAPVVASAVPERILTDAPPTVRDEKPDSQRIEFTDGTTRYSMVVSPVTDVDTVQGYALLLRDVTERHDTQQELQRQHEQFDTFATSVSHHLRNPIQVASGQVQLAREALPDSETRELAEQFDQVESALDRMETIITDLQTLAENGNSVESTETVDFADAVADATSTVSLGSATVSVDRGGTLQADRGRLLSILENLIRNSVEHAGSDVAMTLRLTEEGFVFEDDGPGIDADHDRLFEYGYTTSDDGTGLGLSIVQTMVESHDWGINVDTDHDGARFVVTGAVTTPESETVGQRR